MEQRVEPHKVGVGHIASRLPDGECEWKAGVVLPYLSEVSGKRRSIERPSQCHVTDEESGRCALLERIDGSLVKCLESRLYAPVALEQNTQEHDGRGGRIGDENSGVTQPLWCDKGIKADTLHRAV